MKNKKRKIRQPFKWSAVVKRQVDDREEHAPDREEHPPVEPSQTPTDHGKSHGQRPHPRREKQLSVWVFLSVSGKRKSRATRNKERKMSLIVETESYRGERTMHMRPFDSYEDARKSFVKIAEEEGRACEACLKALANEEYDSFLTDTARHHKGSWSMVQLQRNTAWSCEIKDEDDHRARVKGCENEKYSIECDGRLNGRCDIFV